MRCWQRGVDLKYHSCVFGFVSAHFGAPFPQAIYKVFLSTCASPLALTLLYLYILLVWSLYVNLIDADPLIVMLPTRLSGPKVA